MNIFFLSEDPVLAAQMQCDQHVVKMPLESAQMLCTIYPEDIAPYRRTHFNHPSNLWIRESLSNYEWLLVHALALCDEYSFRYDKVHKSEEVIYWCWANIYNIEFPKKDLTPFPKAMPEEYKAECPVKSYRNFYLKDKSKFARWARNRDMPDWYRDDQLKMTLD